MLIAVVIIVVGLFWLYYKNWVSNYNHWEKQGIEYSPAKLPYGSDPNLVTLKEYKGYTIDKMYYKFAKHSMFGIFILRSPFLVIRDPGIIQLIMTKEFSSFRDRGMVKLTKIDVLDHNLFNLEGEMWRALRIKLLPTFSSGKLKYMFPLFVSCAESFSAYLSSNAGSKIVMKDLASRFTADVICNCSFGLELDAMNHPETKLIKIGEELIKIDFLTKLKSVMGQLFPSLRELIKMSKPSLDDQNYVINLVRNVIEEREKRGIVRNDFIDLMIQIRNKGYIGEDGQTDEKPFELTMDLIAAQCFVFFLAGNETSSSVITFCTYELALHQDIQSRLIDEINEKIEKNGGLTYKAVQEMEYLDMVISETSRKYPTLPMLNRLCTKTVMLPSGQKIEKGTNIIIPVWSLQHDPQYYPDPEKFDPERFSPKNKDSMVPSTYLPFGEGPRMCIGNRFGQLQVKMGIIAVLRKFKVEPCEETKVPLSLGGCSPVTSSAVPIVVKLVPRS